MEETGLYSKQSAPAPVYGKDISTTADGLYRGRVRISNGWLRTEAYSTLQEAEKAWQRLRTDGAEFAAKKAARKQALQQRQHQQEGNTFGPLHSMSHKRQHLSSQSMQPLLRPGQYGAMIPPYPSSSATPQQPKVGDAPVHGHENDHWSSAVKHTKDGAKRSVEKEPANLPPGTGSVLHAQTDTGIIQTMKQFGSSKEDAVLLLQGSGGRSHRHQPEPLQPKEFSLPNASPRLIEKTVVMPTCHIDKSDYLAGVEQASRRDLEQCKLQQAATAVEQVAPGRGMGHHGSHVIQTRPGGFQHPEVTRTTLERTPDPFPEVSRAPIPYVPAKLVPKQWPIEQPPSVHCGIAHHPQVAPACPDSQGQPAVPAHIRPTTAAAAPSNIVLHMLEANTTQQLPRSFAGYKVYLQEVYDQRLQRSGCTELQLSRPLGAGTFGSVQLGWALLTQGNGVSQEDHDYSPFEPCCDGDMHNSYSPVTTSSSDSVLLAAVKIYSSESVDFKREKHALKLLLGKPNIFQLLAVGHVAASSTSYSPVADHSRSFPCLVLQLASGTLEDINQPCSEHQARKWIEQLLEGLAALHGTADQQIIHRDLKPLNLLLDEQQNLLIADFSCCAIGVCASNDSPRRKSGSNADIGPPMGTFVGPEMYMAPEVGHYRLGKCYDRSIDSHSVGVIALGLLIGGRKALLNRCKPVPSGASGQSLSISQFLLEVILGYEQPQFQLSSNFRDFLGACCTPCARLMPEDLINHRWVVGM